MTPAPLAADFQPVAVARCDFVFVAFVPPDGMATGWFWRQVDRGTGAVDRLAAALRKPPPPRRGSGIICSSDPQSGPQDMLYLVLTDAAGRTAIPAIPLDECGKSLAVVARAVAAIRWQTVDSR